MRLPVDNMTITVEGDGEYGVVELLPCTSYGVPLDGVKLLGSYEDLLATFEDTTRMIRNAIKKQKALYENGR